MQIKTVNSNNSFINNKASINFQGMRQLIDAENIASFWQKTREIGTVTIKKRIQDGKNQKLKPIEVSLVEFRFGKKDEKKSKILYSLFEKDYKTATTVEELDKKELGLVEFKYKDLKNATASTAEENEKRSMIALKKVYQEGLKIIHLISYEGDKYKGIGTTLINLVVKKSKELGVKGNVFLYSKNFSGSEYLKNSPYCKSKLGISPTLFYFNYGFIADEKTNKLIAKGNNIDCIAMHLPKEKIKAKLNEIG